MTFDACMAKCSLAIEFSLQFHLICWFFCVSFSFSCFSVLSLSLVLFLYRLYSFSIIVLFLFFALVLYFAFVLFFSHAYAHVFHFTLALSLDLFLYCSCSRSLSLLFVLSLSFSIIRTLSTSLPLPHSLHSRFHSSFYFTFQLNLFYMFPFQRALFSHFNGFAFVFMMPTFIVIFKLIQFVNFVLISAWYISHFCSYRIVQTYLLWYLLDDIHFCIYWMISNFFIIWKHWNQLQDGTIFYLKWQSFILLQVIAISYQCEWQSFFHLFEWQSLLDLFEW